MGDVSFKCDCGQVTGTVREVSPQNVCHLVCYCKDCRAFARHLGRVGELEQGGGSPLVQVTPSKIEIHTGSQNIACLRLSPKGLLRWYAACCKTPLANTVATSKIPLAGMWRANFANQDDFGPVTTLAHTKMALPGGPKRDKGTLGMLGGLLSKAISGLVNGDLRETPFFTREGAPVIEPEVISRESRGAAYKENTS